MKPAAGYEEDEAGGGLPGSRFNRNPADPADYQTPKLGGQGTPTIAKKHESKTNTPQTGAGQLASQRPAENTFGGPSFANTWNTRPKQTDSLKTPLTSQQDEKSD